MNKQDSPKLILFAVCAGQFFLPFTMAGVNSVLPPMGQEIAASAKELSLITTYYALGLATFQLTTGRMGDIWGRKRVFLSGMSIFIVTTCLLGFLSNVYIMQALRFIQGAGAAMFGASGLAILAVSAPNGLRGRYIAFSAMAIYAGIACGPPIAGFIAGSVGWRWLFWGTAAASSITWCFMFFKVHSEWFHGKGEPFDWKGGILYGVGMATFTIGTTLIQDNFAESIILMTIGIGLLAAYVALEWRTEYPILDIRLLAKNRIFALSSLASFINYSSCFGMVLYFSIYLQVVRGMSVDKAGLFLALQFIVQTLSTPLVSTLADKFGPGRISAIGIAFTGIGLCLCAFLERETPLSFFIIAQIILGLGMAFFAAPNTTVMLESVDEAHIGQASGVSGTMRTAGALINTTIISITFGYFLGSQPVGTNNIDLFLQSMRVDFILFGVLNLAAIGCALGRGPILSKKNS